MPHVFPPVICFTMFPCKTRSCSYKQMLSEVDSKRPCQGVREAHYADNYGDAFDSIARDAIRYGKPGGAEGVGYFPGGRRSGKAASVTLHVLGHDHVFRSAGCDGAASAPL